MKRTAWQFLLVGVLILACGQTSTKPGEEPARPPTPPVDGPVYTIRLFGAPWCTNCKADFPKINEALKAELTGDKPRLKGELFVTTGDTPQQKPTQEVADGYATALKLNFSAHVDEWPWKKFREQVQQDRKLPAAVIFDAENNIVKVFQPGPTTFVAEEIVSFVKATLQ